MISIQFSVIIPAYNNVILLKSALSSVIHQKKISLEIIVVDDSTNSEIEEFMNGCSDKRVKYVHNKPNLGAVKNWNYGLSLAKGEYIIIMHHDEYFKNNTDALWIYYNTLICGNRIVISDLEVIKDNCILKRFDMPDKLKEWILKYTPSILYFYNFIGPVSCLCFEKKMMTFFNERLVWLVDVDFYYRLFLKSTKISYCNNVVRSVYGHEGQISKKIDKLKENREDMKILLSVSYVSLSQTVFIKLSYLYRKIKYLVQ